MPRRPSIATFEFKIDAFEDRFTRQSPYRGSTGRRDNRGAGILDVERRTLRLPQPPRPHRIRCPAFLGTAFLVGGLVFLFNPAKRDAAALSILVSLAAFGVANFYWRRYRYESVLLENTKVT